MTTSTTALWQRCHNVAVPAGGHTSFMGYQRNTASCINCEVEDIFVMYILKQQNIL